MELRNNKSVTVLISSPHTVFMAGSLCTHSKQKVCWHGSSLGSVYWSRQTPHVNWSSNCRLNDTDLAILNAWDTVKDMTRAQECVL